MTGTVFESGKVPPKSRFVAMNLMMLAKNSVWAIELKRNLGVSCPTVWLLKHKIIKVMTLSEA